MIAALPDREFGVLRIVDLHRRARRIAGAAADTFFLINLKSGLAVYLRRPDGRHRAARYDRRALTHICHEIVVNLGRLGVLDINRDISLTAAIDLAARGRDVHPVRHIAVFELIDQFIHHCLDYA